MMQTASKYSVVNCDICGDRMKKQNDVYACYPCNTLFTSELSTRYDTVRRMYATSEIKRFPLHLYKVTVRQHLFTTYVFPATSEVMLRSMPSESPMSLPILTMRCH